MNNFHSNNFIINPLKSFKKINGYYFPNNPSFYDIDLNKFIINKNIQSFNNYLTSNNKKNKLYFKDSLEIIKNPLINNPYLPHDFHNHKKYLNLILYSFDINFFYTSGLFLINFLLYLSLLDRSILDK